MSAPTVHVGQHTHSTRGLSRGPCWVLCLDGVPVAATDRIGGRTVLQSGQQSVSFSAAATAPRNDDEAEALADLVEAAADWQRAKPSGADRWVLDIAGPNLSRTTFGRAQ